MKLFSNSIKFFINWMNFLFSNWLTFFKFVNFFQYWWNFLKIDELYKNQWTFSKLMNFFSILWTFVKIWWLFLQIRWTFVLTRWTFFKVLNMLQTFWNNHEQLRIHEFLYKIWYFLYLIFFYILLKIQTLTGELANCRPVNRWLSVRISFF